MAKAVAGEVRAAKAATVKCKLSEAEVAALRDEALEQMTRGASEGEHDQVIAAADIYGALRNVELVFARATGLPAPVEFAEPEFTEAAMDLMRKLRREFRSMLADMRGSIEINLEHTPKDTFLLFVLDGIFGEEVAA